MFKGNGSRRSIVKLSKIEKACFAYVGKSRQLEYLYESLPNERLMVVDYDNLCRNPGERLPQVFRFIGEPYDSQYANQLHSHSIGKQATLTGRERDLVTRHCLETYENSMTYVTGGIVL